MADRIQLELGVTVELVPGERGEFTVRVDGAVVAKKGLVRFPGDDRVLREVRTALARG